MKLHRRFLLVLLSVVGSANSASACWLWPWGGYWGAGYYGTPASYGYYRPMVYSAGYAPAGYYSASYYGGSSIGCCDPCGNACGGNCASGSCGSSCTGVVSDSLKPTTDPNFRNGDDSYDRDRTAPARDEADPLDDKREFRSRSNSTTDDPPNDSFESPGTRRSIDPADDTGAGSGLGSGTDNPMFEGTSSQTRPDNTNETTDQITNKPPMSDPAAPAADDANKSAAPDATTGDGKTFLGPNNSDAGAAGSETGDESDNEKLGAPQARRSLPMTLASRSSSLDEVVKPRRLASRSLPATSSAGSIRHVASKKPLPDAAPLRWIEAPATDGRVRL